LRGDLRQLAAQLPTMLEEVAERGNLLVERLLRARMSWFVRLVGDRPGEALDGLEEAGTGSCGEHFLLHFFQVTAIAEIALYRGDGPAASTAIEDGWPEVVRSKQLLVPLGRVVVLQLRCRCALAATASDPGAAARRRLRKTIRRDLRRMEAQKLGWSDALADLVRAGVASLDGDDEQTLERLTAAEVGFESADMELYAAVSRRRRGQLLARLGGGGEDLVAAAVRWMAEQGIRDPGRMADALAPGSWTRDLKGSRTA
jgi:hypothetical protein